MLCYEAMRVAQSNSSNFMHLLPSPLRVRGCVRASGLCCVPGCVFAAPVLWGGVMEPRREEGLSVPVALCACSAVLSVPSVPP